jgi:hypothetical protein
MVVVQWCLGVYKVRFNHKFVIVVGLCLVDLFPIFISHQNRFLAVDRLHGKEVVPFINHCELGLAVRYLGSWCCVLWNKNKLPLLKASSCPVQRICCLGQRRLPATQRRGGA